MALFTLLKHPIAPILGLCFVLLGIGIVSPSRVAQTAPRTYTTIPVPSVRTSVIQEKAKTTPDITTPVSKSVTSLKHYSVPSSLRGDEGGEFGD